MKMPKATKLKSGSWRVQIRVNGRSYSITRPTKAEAEHDAMKMRLELDEKHEEDLKYGPTFSEAIDTYVAKRVNIVSPSTILGYRAIQRNYFQDIMDERITAQIDWQGIINRDAGKLSAKTLKNAYGLIKAVYRDNGMTAPDVRLPQVIRNERPFLNPDEIPVFLDAIKGRTCEVAALLALHGLRRSEILALEKKDIKDGFIFVNGAAVFDENHNLVKKKENKTKNSKRVVPVMYQRLSDLIEALPDGPIVTVGADQLGKRINVQCRRAGLPEVGVHGLRHTFASLGLHTGMNAHELMRLGGWSDINTMNRIYTHVYERSLTAKTNAMGQFFEDLDKEKRPV